MCDFGRAATPKMLNTDDWPHGFYEYNQANRDAYFDERIPDTGMGTPIAKQPATPRHAP